MMREGGVQKMLNEYCTVLNQYFDRECEWIHPVNVSKYIREYEIRR